MFIYSLALVKDPGDRWVMMVMETLPQNVRNLRYPPIYLYLYCRRSAMVDSFTISFFAGSTVTDSLVTFRIHRHSTFRAIFIYNRSQLVALDLGGFQ